MTGTTISGGYVTGITLGNPADNPAHVTGSISVASGAALTGAKGTAWTVTNSGQISSQGTSSGSYGIVLGSGGFVTNQSGGSISGSVGVYIEAGAGTVTNAGGIAGAKDAVLFAAGSNDRLVMDPGATFTGQVDGGNTIGATAVSSLELASGTSLGTLTGLGTQFVDFSQIIVDAGAYWTLSGYSGVASTIVAGATLRRRAKMNESPEVASPPIAEWEIPARPGAV